MAINERLVHTASAAAAGTGNQEEGLILHLDANDVDSYDGDGTEWVDITNHEYTPTTNVSEHFNTVLYTGNGTSSISVNGAGFQPDLIIQKNRDASSSFNWYDSVRGATKLIYSSGVAGQVTYSGITSFDSDGFTNGSSENANTNKYVAWCFKAGGAAVSNTDGTITSQVSANNNLGFSIVKWSGDNSAATIGHGLDIAPEIVIRKNLASSSSWAFDTSGIDGSWDYLFLDTTAASANHSSLQPPSSTTFNTSGTSYNSSSMIAYCFASKRGVSKVGSYVGKTGSVKVYTGFEPAFVLIKKTNTTTNANWSIFDNARVNGTVKGQLYPDSSSVENDRNGLISFNRDGFTLENNTVGQVNTNNDSYIYYAVAKNTNETSLIPDTDLELHLDASDLTTSSTSWVDNIDSNNSGTLGNATYEKELGDSVYIPATGFSSGNVINFSNNPVHNQTTYTIESWVKFGDYSVVGSASYIGLSNHSAEGHTSGRTPLAGYPTGVYRDYIDQTNYASNGGVTDFYWHHCVSVRQGTSLKQYLDGELVGTHTVSSNAPSSDEMTLGAYKISSSTYNSYLGGDIGQVRIYSAGLTQDQIRQNFNFTKNNYPNGYDGTISGATWNAGGYFNFDGTDDWVNTNYTPPAGNGNFSVACWFDYTYTIQAKGVFSTITNSGTDRRGLNLNVYGGAVRVIAYDSAGAAELTGNSITDGLHHSVITYEGGLIKLYIDGQLQVNTINQVITSHFGTIGIGLYYRSLTSNSNWNGEISQFKVYESVLTQAEIDVLYNEGQ